MKTIPEAARSCIGPTFCLIAAAIVAGFAVIHLTGILATRATRSAVLDHEAIANVQDLLSAVKDAEAGQRGYLLTNDRSYLEAYRRARDRIEPEEAELARHAAARDLLAANAERLSSLVDQRVGELQDTLRAASARGRSAALAAVQAGHGKDTMERLRTLSQAMSDASTLRLSRDVAAARFYIAARTWVFLAVGILNLLLLLWVFRRVRAEMEARESAVQRSLQESQSLRTTLASIGDGVIIADPNGLVRFLNPEAERLTAWTQAQAREQPIRDVFRLVAEDDRARVLPLAGAALRERRTVRIAERALLIDRSGSAVPVDASASAIQGEGEPQYGAVLVFQDARARRRAEEAVLRERATLKVRVDERTAELRRTIDDLERFTYTVAHDLRAPLRTVHRYSELLLAGAGRLPPESSRAHLQRVMDGALKMDRLIQDLLAYARIGRAQMRLEPLDPGDAARRCLASMSDLLDESGADVRISDFPCRVVGDRFLLERALCNLISNAVKFVAPGTRPRVEIGEERSGGRARVWVKDNGIGIEPRHRDRLFNVFERLHSADEYPGTGVGLAIVGKAAERMGGRAGFASEPGRGSRFWIELPAAEWAEYEHIAG